MVRVMDNHFEADGEPVLTYCLRYESGIELTVTNLGGSGGGIASAGWQAGSGYLAGL